MTAIETLENRQMMSVTPAAEVKPPASSAPAPAVHADAAPARGLTATPTPPARGIVVLQIMY